MRKLYLLPALLFLLLTSCQEEEVSPLTLRDQLKGTWVTVAQEQRYYDAAGQLVHEATPKAKTVFDFNEANLTTTYSTGTATICTYTFLEREGKDYLRFTHNGRMQDFEVTSITGSGMRWQFRLEKAPYKAGAMLKEADHATITLSLTRQ